MSTAPDGQLQATEHGGSVQASLQEGQYVNTADQLPKPEPVTEDSKSEQLVQSEQQNSDLQQVHPENRLHQAETNSFQLAEKETGYFGQQSIAGSKVDVAQPSVSQQNGKPIVGQQAPTSAQDTRKGPSIPFNMVIPILQAHLDRDKDMQLQAVWAKLMRNEVHKDDFLNIIRNIVGGQMLKHAAHKVFLQMQAQAQRNNQANPSQNSLSSQVSTQQMPTWTAQPCSEKPGSVATGDLNFTSTQPPITPAPFAVPALPAAPTPTPLAAPTGPIVPAPLAVPTLPAAATLSAAPTNTSGQSLNHSNSNANPSALDGQDDEPTEVQSNPPNQDSRQGEGGSKRKRKQSHIGAVLEGFVEFRKEQTNKAAQALEEKRSDEQFSIEKCLDELDALEGLTDEDKSYAMDVFESVTDREMFIKSRNHHNARLLWLKRKIRSRSTKLVHQ